MGFSLRVLACFDEDDEDEDDGDDVIVLGMPWRRGHALSMVSALRLSQ